jgi:hypothetical protein
MGRKTYPSNVVEQARDVLVGWEQVSEDLTFGTLTREALTADIAAAAPIEAEIIKLEMLVAEKREQRDILYNGMWDKTKRIRAGVKANYGDDSQQFEWVGGTRVSDRKPRARKGSTAAVAG